MAVDFDQVSCDYTDAQYTLAPQSRKLYVLSST